jgi:predicted RNA-binding protein YlxR (DUF448 family)
MENEQCKVKSIKEPIRMCIGCRERFLRKELLRLQCKNGQLIEFSGVGRSFYICKNCITSKKVINYVSKKCNVSKDEAKLFILHFSFYT